MNERRLPAMPAERSWLLNVLANPSTSMIDIRSLLCCLVCRKAWQSQEMLLEALQIQDLATVTMPIPPKRRGRRCVACALNVCFYDNQSLLRLSRVACIERTATTCCIP